MVYIILFVVFVMMIGLCMVIVDYLLFVVVLSRGCSYDFFYLFGIGLFMLSMIVLFVCGCVG